MGLGSLSIHLDAKSVSWTHTKCLHLDFNSQMRIVKNSQFSIFNVSLTIYLVTFIFVHFSVHLVHKTL